MSGLTQEERAGCLGLIAKEEREHRERRHTTDAREIIQGFFGKYPTPHYLQLNPTVKHRDCLIKCINAGVVHSVIML